MEINTIELTNEEQYDISPLDCIVFSGTDIVSKSILCIQRYSIGVGEWSHIGVVVNRKVLPSLNVKDDELYIWESTISTTNKLISPDPTLDAETQKQVFGIQIRKLKDVIHYGLKNGVKLAVAKLQSNPCIKLENESQSEYDIRLSYVKKKLFKIHKENHHRSYAKNICRLFAAVLPCLVCCREDCCLGEDWMFCSQFVCLVYKEIDIIPQNIDTETVIPQDLISPMNSKEGLPVIFSNIIYINKN